MRMTSLRWFRILTVAVLAQHTSLRVRDAVGDMLDRIHSKYGVCGQYLIPHTRFSELTRFAWEERLLRALATRRVGLLCSPLVCCSAAHMPQLQRIGVTWTKTSYSYKGREVCIVAGPVGHLLSVNAVTRICMFPCATDTPAVSTT